MPTPTTTPLTLKEWRQFLTRNFSSLSTQTPSDAGFAATFAEATFGKVEFYEIVSEPHTLERSEGLIGPAASKDIKLYLQTKGTTIVEQSGRSCALRPGELTIFVTHLPYVVRFPNAQEGLLVKFPAHLLQTSIDVIERISTTRLCESEGLGAVLIPAFRKLTSLTSDSHSTYAVQSLEHLLESIVLALQQQNSLVFGENSDQLFEKATHFIDQNLRNPELGASSVAQALYVSLRNLQKHFSDHELTVTRYIRSRRLHLIQRDLANPSLCNLSVMEIAEAHGLTDPSHLSRAFKAEFGVSPRQFRLSAVG